MFERKIPTAIGANQRTENSFLHTHTTTTIYVHAKFTPLKTSTACNYHFAAHLTR